MEIIVALVVFIIMMVYVYNLQCNIDELRERIRDIEAASQWRYTTTLKGLTNHTEQIRDIARRPVVKHAVDRLVQSRRMTSEHKEGR